MCEISIIVPVYNVEKYLNKCVDSILKQTFGDFELILVDDGSPDNSGAICDQYAEEDSRVKVIHKENGGLSDARNAGIEIAKGNYIGFVDSDDYIDKNMYKQLYDSLTKNDVDLSICGIFDVYEGKESLKKSERELLLNRDEAMVMIFHGNEISVHAYNKLYKKEIFKYIRYPVGRYHEDSYIIVDILDKCEKVAINTKQMYHYLHREESITGQSFSVKQLEYIDAWEKNEELVKGRFQKLDEAAHQRVCFANFLILDKIVSDNQEKIVPETRKIVSYLRRNFFFILKNNIFTKERKIAMALLMVSLKLYKLPVDMQNKRLRVV